MDTDLAIIVLAAGQGTRMKSATPKLLHTLAGAPIVAHVLATARALDAAHVIAVVRHERDEVAAAIEAELPGTVIVDQDEIPGTGRAVEQAIGALPVDFGGEVLVLNGDVPLLDAGTLAAFLEQHRADAAEASVLSAIYDDPSGYGRVVRDAAGAFDRIVEQKDATAEERAIAEINAGIYAFGAGALRDQLANLTTDNAQGEKYLTDVIGLLRAAGCEVEAVPVSEPWLVAGINDRAQLSEAAARLNALIVRGWQLNGVTIDDPATTWIDLAVRIEPDVTIRPGTQLKGATVIATGAIVGPDTTLVDCEIGQNAEVKRTDGTLAVVGRRGIRRPVLLPPAGHDARLRRQGGRLRRGEERQDRRRQQGAASLLRRRRDHRRALEHRRRIDLRELRRRTKAPLRDRLAREERGARRLRRAR